MKEKKKEFVLKYYPSVISNIVMPRVVFVVFFSAKNAPASLVSKNRASVETKKHYRILFFRHHTLCTDNKNINNDQVFFHTRDFLRYKV